MEISTDNKLEILQMNLDSLKSKDKINAFIIVDFETTEEWLNHLEILERFEDCSLIKKYRKHFIYKD